MLKHISDLMNPNSLLSRASLRHCRAKIKSFSYRILISSIIPKNALATLLLLLMSMQPLNAAETCTALSETCTARGTLTQNGFTMRNVCIERAVVYECITEREINHCAILASDARCEFIAETCAQRKDGLCVDFESTYGCTDGTLEYANATLKDRKALSVTEDWITDCQNPDACVLEQTTCTEGPGTRTINGFEFERQCWKEELVYSCTRDSASSSCAIYEDNPDCAEAGSTCLTLVDGTCTHAEIQFSCTTQVSETVEKTCTSDTVCIGDECTTYEDEKDSNYPLAAAWLQFLHQASKDRDADTEKLFKGQAEICRKKGFDWKNCCTGGGLGLGLFLASCRQSEQELLAANAAKRTVYITSWCVEKIFGYCLSSRRLYCVFNSKVGRIIQEQGRAQLKRGFGDRYQPNCAGFSVATLEALDMEAMDLSELVPDIEETNLSDKEYLSVIVEKLKP